MTTSRNDPWAKYLCVPQEELLREIEEKTKAWKDLRRATQNAENELAAVEEALRLRTKGACAVNGITVLVETLSSNETRVMQHDENDPRRVCIQDEGSDFIVSAYSSGKPRRTGLCSYNNKEEAIEYAKELVTAELYWHKAFFVDER